MLEQELEKEREGTAIDYDKIAEAINKTNGWQLTGIKIQDRIYRLLRAMEEGKGRILRGMGKQQYQATVSSPTSRRPYSRSMRYTREVSRSAYSHVSCSSECLMVLYTCLLLLYHVYPSAAATCKEAKKAKEAADAKKKELLGDALRRSSLGLLKPVLNAIREEQARAKEKRAEERAAGKGDENDEPESHLPGYEQEEELVKELQEKGVLPGGGAHGGHRKRRHDHIIEELRAAQEKWERSSKENKALYEAAQEQERKRMQREDERQVIIMNSLERIGDQLVDMNKYLRAVMKVPHRGK